MADNWNITPAGARDLLYKECEARREVESRLSALFIGSGYSEVVTPSLEFYDVFSGSRSVMDDEYMYKLIDARGRILVLRPDNTTPIARVVSTKLKGFAPPLRLFYNQRVFRVSPSLTGRRDEIAQCGAELVGVGGARADIDIITTAVAALQAVTPDFRFELGHVGFFNALIEDLPFGASEKQRIRGYIDSKNYASLSALLSPRAGESAACRALAELPRLFGGAEVLDRALELAPGERAAEPVRYLKTIYDTLCALGYEQNIMLDLGLVQQIDYYTGVVFKGYTHGLGEAVLFGGRYDELYEKFGAPMPATGFAVNVDGVARVRAAGLKSSRADVLVHYEPGCLGAALAHARALVEKGLVCEQSVFESAQEAEEYARAKGIARLDIVAETVTTRRVAKEAAE